MKRQLNGYLEVLSSATIWVLVLVIGGCSTTTRYGTHAYMGQCIFVRGGEAFPAAIGAAILPHLITEGVNYIGNALEEAAKAHTDTRLASVNFESSKQYFPGCVQIARGHFHSNKSALNFDWIKNTKFGAKATQLQQSNILLASEPDFFFEGNFRISKDASAMSIYPVFLQFQGPIERRTLRPSGTRDVKLAFSIHKPEKAATDATSSSTELVFGRLEPRTIVEFDTQETLASGGHTFGGTPVAGGAAKSEPSPIQPKSEFQPGPPPPSATEKSEPQVTVPSAAPQFKPAPAGDFQPGSPSSSGTERSESPASSLVAVARPNLAFPNESLWFKTSLTDNLTPYSMTVTVSETQEASKLLSFVSSVFTASEDDIEKVLKQNLIEAERDKARLVRLNERKTVHDAYDNALVAAVRSLDACKAAGTIANAADARAKQRAANIAAEQVDLGRPFANLIPMDTNPAAVTQACGDSLNSLKSLGNT